MTAATLSSDGPRGEVNGASIAAAEFAHSTVPAGFTWLLTGDACGGRPSTIAAASARPGFRAN
jgi:hypothetical protein